MNRGTGVSIVALAMIGGCSVRTLDLYIPTDNLDLLFVVDDSPGTRPIQQALLRSFPTFLTTLQNVPPGGPGIHLAVVSTDLGAGDGSIVGCDATGGKNGIFQRAPRGACAVTSLDPGATFISDVDGVRNYSGQLADVFSCIASLGESGCGFEHPLAAAARALGADGLPPPPENRGFLRPSAFLAIIIVTNEDDCSAPAGSPVFDTKANTALDSPLGPISNFRCNEFGHLCGGKRPPRLAPTGHASDVVMLNDCVPAEREGLLTPIADLVEQIRSVKPFPDQQIMVAAITGPKDPYLVQWSPGAAGLLPQVKASCTGADGSSGAPAVRISEFVRAFGAGGLMLPICSDTYAPSLQRITERLVAGAYPAE
jgi:hypothetical protein